VVNDYFFLIKTRFVKAIELTIDLEEADAESIYIPPATLQLLIENAVKHNKLSDAEPLQLKIALKNNHILVENTLNKRTVTSESTQVDLKNIQKRYQLISENEVIIEMNDNTFRVFLPILNRKHYDNINH
jgi:LytS/YehU family sensor histidine kinase